MEGYKRLTTYILATVICDLNVEFVREGGFRETLFRKRAERIARIGLPFGRFSAKDNITQGKGNEKKRKSNYSQQIDLYKIHKTSFLNLYAKPNVTIPAVISTVNSKNFDDGSIPGNTGDTIATPNQNTEKLIRKSAMTESRAESNFFTTNNSNISMANFQYIATFAVVIPTKSEGRIEGSCTTAIGLREIPRRSLS